VPQLFVLRAEDTDDSREFTDGWNREHALAI
jgi:hypothetical protein